METPIVKPAPASGGIDQTATQPIATAQAPTASYLQKDDLATLNATNVQQGVARLRGPAARVVENMEASLDVPTATSVRTIPAKLIMDNRVVINNHLARTRGGKVSFTHLIGFAIVEALAQFPSMNVAYAQEDGKPAVYTPPHVNFGLAIDLAKADGARQLLVPNIKNADQMDFAQFWHAYDDVIKKARTGALQPQDFQGTTITLTNPGTLGTVHSVPRLMPGQGAIIGVGSMDYPAEYQAIFRRDHSSPRHLQGHDSDVDLRPPGHSGRAVGASSWRWCTRSCWALTGSTTALP